MVDMLHFTISLAGLNIGINALSRGIYGYCIKYLTNEKPEFVVTVTQEDIDQEKRKRNNPFQDESDVDIESAAVFRKILEAVVDFDIILMHGAVVGLGNKSYLFTAPSGTGKTTHVKQWIKKAPGSIIVNGDKPLIRMTEGEVFACGTPWCGKERKNTNVMLPLKAIVLMQRSEGNSIIETSFQKVYSELLLQTQMPKNPQKVKRTLDLLAGMDGTVPVYRFYFNNFKDNCFQVAYDTLVGKRNNSEQPSVEKGP